MKPCILFDFDGVIVDTFETTFLIMDKFQPKGITREQYRRMFDRNVFDELAKKAKAEHRERGDMDKFFDIYKPLLLELKPTEGIKEALRELHEFSTIIVVSSSRDDLIDEFLKKYSMRDFVKGIYGKDDGEHKDTKFEKALSDFGGSCDDACFVTDTLGDIKEAESVGLKTIAVTWGYQEEETLKKGSPSAIVSSPQDLVQAIKKVV